MAASVNCDRLGTQFSVVRITLYPFFGNHLPSLSNFNRFLGTGQLLTLFSSVELSPALTPALTPEKKRPEVLLAYIQQNLE